MKRLCRNVLLTLLLSICGHVQIINAAAAPGLVGIVNNCRKATANVVDKDGKVLVDASGKPLVAYKGGVLQCAPIAIPDARAFSKDQKFANALNIKLDIDRGSDGIISQYVQIVLYAESENQLIVRAARADVPGDFKEARITNATNSAYMPGVGPSPWQGLFLAFKDEGKPPYFSFAITSWASNRDEWINSVGKNFLKTNQTVDGKITFKDRKNQDLYLRIIQGQQAYGGGVVPFPRHAHLVHIYNNTNWALLMIRMWETTNKTDSLIIPVQSVVPYAMEWVPVRTQGQENEKGLAVPGIKIALLSPQSRQRPPRVGEYFYKSGAGMVTAPSTIDIKQVLDNMRFRSSDNTAEVMNDTGFDSDVKSIFEAIKPTTGETSFFANKVEYRVWTRAATNQVIVATRNADTLDTKEVASVNNAYTDQVRPGYFSLIVTENRDKDAVTNPLKFTLVRMDRIENPNIVPAK